MARPRSLHLAGAGRRRPGVACLVLLAAGLLPLAACSSGGNTIAAQANGYGGQSYIAGDGTVQRIKPADRRTTIAVTGRTLEGAPLDTASYRGKVVVLNTWGSWCPPCNAEAPLLERTWKSFAGKDVQFVGVDLREGPAAGLAFQRKFAITYPSVQWDGGAVLVQLKGKASATPTTLVLDRQGRLAGRISGESRGAALRDLVQAVLGEAPAQPPSGSAS